jgi:hypothetical protein
MVPPRTGKPRNDTSMATSNDFPAPYFAAHAQVKAAIGRVRDRRAVLAARIATELAAYFDATGATSLDVGGVPVARVTVSASCSDGAAATVGRETAIVIGGRALLLPVDCGFFDGHNMQHQRGPTAYKQAVLYDATVAETVDLARALPDAIASALAGYHAIATADAARIDAELA